MFLPYSLKTSTEAVMPVQVIYITAALLLLDIFPLPAVYHSYLTIVAGGTFAWGTYVNFLRKTPLPAVIYALFAVLYNPIVEIEAARLLWIVADLAAAALLITTKDHIV
jgi:hypothetical protein